MIIPPFAGVALVECHDRIELRPYYWCREFVGLGRIKASDVQAQSGGLSQAFLTAWNRRKIWVITTWRQFEDGREEPLLIEYLDPDATEKKARAAYAHQVEFASYSKEELEELQSLFRATDDDRAYIENRFPDVKAPAARSRDERELYQVRLKVLAGMQPNTAALLAQADAERNDDIRARIERQAVEAFFADMARHWPDEAVKAWQQTNPVGTKWMLRLASQRKKSPHPIDHELALNWLRRKYNLLTAEELSQAVYAATGKKMTAEAIKKRRERLNLITKRRPGPRPNPEE